MERREDMTIEKRLADLRSDWIDESTLKAIYGLDLTNQAFERDLIRWDRLLRRPRDVLKEGKIRRFALETYFQHKKLMPARWAGARIGMDNHSFDEIIQVVEERGLSEEFRTNTGLVSEAIDRLLIQILPPLQNRIFSDHDNFCRRLHEVIKDEWGLAIQPLHCVTAVALKERDYSYAFCMLTDQPVGLRYRVWLDLGKPMNLPPDTCSYVAYFDNQALLASALLGSQPERPAAL
jgi:hypothetical protein